ncbi:pantothenate synthase [Lignoscripta atroalba]|nr:pantothenate synthase [Lignoscripta atroalba]
MAVHIHKVYSRVFRKLGQETAPSRILKAPPSVQICHDVQSFRKLRHQLLLKGRRVGLVPTMGALHDGHLALIRHAASLNDDVVVSIFVNPTQFGANEDLNSYPKPWLEDIKKLWKLRAEFNAGKQRGQIRVVLAPTANTMYPGLPPTSEVDGHGSFVTITPIGSILEGASRPVFFRGVATVCMKLLNIVQPENVYFGQKDIQQCVLVNRMMKDFHVNTRMDIIPTSRESDGLAMSSRNVYLGQRRRAVATVLSKALRAAASAYASGKRKRGDILDAALQVASSIQEVERNLPPHHRARFEVDYISVADPSSMMEIEEVDTQRGAIVSGAVKMLPLEEPQAGEDTGLGGGSSTVRLIDNVLLDHGKALSTMLRG